MHQVDPERPLLKQTQVESETVNIIQFHLQAPLELLWKRFTFCVVLLRNQCYQKFLQLLMDNKTAEEEQTVIPGTSALCFTIFPQL